MRSPPVLPPPARRTARRAPLALLLPAAAAALALYTRGDACAPPQAGERAAGPRQDGGEARAKLALVVGIDRYAPGTKDLAPLQGAARDAALVRDLLVGRFGFEPADVVTLIDEQATVAAVVGAFERHLIARAGPESEVVFWFSGHGSRVPDASGREIEGLDSSLVAWDSRAAGRDGSFDLSDDLLASLRQALARRTARVTFVTDACHSGGVTRSGGGPRARAARRGSEAVDLDLYAPFWPADVPVLDDGDERRLPGASYVHIAACRPEQQAQEIELEDGGAHGALTFFLTRRLLAAQPGASYASVARDAAVDLATRFPGQTLCYEGAVERTLFDGRFAPRRPGFEARPVADGQISVQAGTMLGLRTGSLLEIYRELAGEPLGNAVVERANAFTAIARWEDPAPAEVPQGALRALERSRPAGQEPLHVHVAVPELLPALARCADMVAAGAGDPSAYRIELDQGRAALLAPEGVRIYRERKESAAGPWSDARRASVAGALEVELRQELLYQALQGLALGESRLKVVARFVPPTAEEIARHSDHERTFVDAGVEPARSGDWSAGPSAFQVSVPAGKAERLAVLAVENTTGRDVYVAVLSIMENRERFLVWPPDLAQEILPPNAVRRIPVGIVTDPDWPLERPMRDRYLVFATERFADFRPLQRGTLDEPERTRGAPEAPLPELVAAALQGPVLRGGPRVATDADGWGVTTVDVLVETPRARPVSPDRR